MASSLESLTVRYHLAEEDVDKQITDKHIEVISRSSCKKWRFLYAHLDLASIDVDNIDHMQVDEDQKRFKFLITWKEKKGSEATYKKLISALHTMECRQDAECVCELLKGLYSVQQQQQQAQSNASLSTTLSPSDTIGNSLHVCIYTFLISLCSRQTAPHTS